MKAHAAILALILAPWPALADEWRLRADGETWQLPAGESMGMGRLALRRRVAPWLDLGIEGSAAVRGERGGFITLGVGGEATLPLASRWDVEAGFAIGAGGGRGGYQLSGGGLLLRVNAGLRYRLDARDAIGAGVSHVDFPNGGTIRSTGAYLTFLHGFDTGAQRTREDPLRPGARLALEAEAVDVDAGVPTVEGGAQGRIGLVGAEWRQPLSGRWFARLAAAGAAGGSSSGYMQALVGLGRRFPLAPRITALAALSVGAGGGGGVQTGGGFLAEAEGALAFSVHRNEAIEVAYLRRRAPSVAFAANALALRVVHRFGADDDAPGDGAHTATGSHDVRVRWIDQQYRGTSADWASRPNQGFGTLGIAADYFLGPSLYVTGQGLAAYSGRNGAYMIGLAGAGWHQPLGGPFHAELELLAGAAGGGGTQVGSGAVAQVNAALGWQGPHGLGASLGVGRLESRRGAFAANVFGLAVSWRTTLGGG